MANASHQTNDNNSVIVFGMGGTIDKDYPRSTKGYAFEIDDPAATRILSGLPNLGIKWLVKSICRKDSIEINDEDRMNLVSSITACKMTHSQRIIVTHGTDTMIETALFVLKSGCAEGKRIVFTGAMKPDKFKDSDAEFNMGGAIAATSIIPSGSVHIFMGGNVFPCQTCRRCLKSGLFLSSSSGDYPECDGSSTKSNP
jgi:L-asparaginase|mmetsp:Transcript_22880/g.35320  ORF Transcript_22880/g.35320 Transcript_22880/m.35320 type:complete len:199 (-) Transcript_22880:327-923(-)